MSFATLQLRRILAQCNCAVITHALLGVERRREISDDADHTPRLSRTGQGSALALARHSGRSPAEVWIQLLGASQLSDQAHLSVQPRL